MAATTDAAAGGGPTRSLEVELKFDVDESTPLPDWSLLPGIADVASPEVRDLDARYLDTETLAPRTRAGALRRRTGGPDAGWHLKGPRVGDGRIELGWPLGPDDEDVPAAVRAAVVEVTDAALHPIARIRNARTAYVLLDDVGAAVAEFVDDQVEATDERSGTVRRWREWEFELGPAAPVEPEERGLLFAAVERAVHAAGGRAAASDSKLARALGA